MGHHLISPYSTGLCLLSTTYLPVGTVLCFFLFRTLDRFSIAPWPPIKVTREIQVIRLNNYLGMLRYRRIV